MLAEPMSVEKAKEIAAAVQRGRLRYGAQYSPPYQSYEIVEAVSVLFSELGAAYLELQAHVPKEELTLVRRQLGACEARVAKLSKNKSEKNSDEG